MLFSDVFCVTKMYLNKLISKGKLYFYEHLQANEFIDKE